MTKNQEAFQDQVERKSGRYAKINPCERCGRSAGVDYFSLSNCNETGRDVCLCKRCAVKYQNQIDNGTFES